MAIWTLTWEKAQKLLADVANKEKEIEILTGKSPKDLWRTDLDEFLAEWKHQLEEDIRLAQTVVKRKSGGKVGAKGRGGKGKKKMDNDTEDEYDASPKRKKAAPKKQTTLPFAVEKVDKKPAARAAAKRAPIVIDDDDGLDDEDFDMIEAAAPMKAPQPAKPKAEPVKPKRDELDGSDLEVINKFGSKAKAQPKVEEADDFATADEGPAIKSEDDSGSDIAIKPKARLLPKKAAASAKPAAKSKNPAAAKPAPKAKPAADLLDYELSEGFAPKPRAKRAATAKPSILLDSDSDDQLGDVSALVKGVDGNVATTTRPLLLSSRPAAAASKPTIPAKRAIPKESISVYDSDDYDRDGLALTKPAAKAKPAPKKAAAPPKKAVPAKPTARSRAKVELEDDHSDLDLDIDRTVDELLDSDVEVKPKAKARAAPAKKAAPAPKAKPAPADEEPSPPLRARAGRAAATKAKYRISSSDEEDEGDEGDEEDLYGDDDEDD